MNANGALTIIGFEAEAVKRLTAVKIEPPAVGVVTIAGQNAAGKSSVLDAVMYALGGKDAQPSEPIRRGAKQAKVTLDLGAFRVKWTRTAKDSYLVVERHDGAKGARPQEFLDARIGRRRETIWVGGTESGNTPAQLLRVARMLEGWPEGKPRGKR